MAWGRSNSLRPAGEASLSSKDNRIELSRGLLTEWYVNSPEGLEQGFTIPAASGGEGAGLMLDLKLEGTLLPRFAEYDTLRSGLPADFQAAADCVESDDGPNTSATDVSVPSVGRVFYYLTRAENACPLGMGSLGTKSHGVPRVGRSCP